MNAQRIPIAGLLLLFLVSAARADDPIENPVAAFYSGPEGYPAWTDALRWDRVINMKTYTKGKTEYKKFLKARDELSEGGGVMYYPAGTYDFSTMPAGVGLLLSPGVIIRGEAPSDRQLASSGKLDLTTKFVFAFRDRGGSKVPRDFNFIGLQPDDRKAIKTINDVGIVWVHLVGATVNFGPQMEWTKTWGSAKAPLNDKIKGSWSKRDPSGTHPFDALVGGGKKYAGAGKRRLIFGCVFGGFSAPGRLPGSGLRHGRFPGFAPLRAHYCVRVACVGGQQSAASKPAQLQISSEDRRKGYGK